jgi:zinc protease
VAAPSGDGWFRKNTIGEVTALLGVQPARLREIYGRYYVPNNAALVVTGDVSAERVIEAARRHFGSWRRRPDPFAGAPVGEAPPLAASRVVVVSGPVEAVTLTLQWQGPSVGADRAETYAADVLAEVVNDEQSDLTHRLVDTGLSSRRASTTRRSRTSAPSRSPARRRWSGFPRR